MLTGPVSVRLGCALLRVAGRGRPAATHFSLLRQRKVSKRKATLLAASLRFAAGNLRCSVQPGSGTNSPSAQTSAGPDPSGPALLGASRRGGRRNTKPPTDKEQIRTPEDTRTRLGESLLVLVSWYFGIRSPLPIGPCVCAEERRARRIRAHACLSEASLHETPAGPSTAGCPGAKRRGRRHQGRLFFGDFLLAKQKKVTCSRATPGQPPSAENPTSRTTTGDQQGKAC